MHSYSSNNLQKNLKTLQGGKAEYNKLTNREKLGVLYQGDKNAKFAGGIGGLQLTAANYGGLQNFEKDLNTKYGSGFSIQPKFTQSAYFRFHNKSEIYDGLYLSLIHI